MLASLSRADLQDWFVDEVQGGSALTGFYRPDDQSPHAAVGAVYLLLDRTTRHELELIVFDLLKKLQRADPAWPIDAVRELLLSIDPILVDSSYRQSAIDEVRALADAEQQVPGESGTTLLAECLQALLSLGYRGSVRFWREAYERGGEHYAELVAGALMEIDAGVAIEFIASLPWSDAAESALFGILPTLIDDKGIVRAAEVVLHYKVRWPADVYELLRECFATEGFAIDHLVFQQRTAYIEQMLKTILGEPAVDSLQNIDAFLRDGPYTRAELSAEVQATLMRWDPFRNEPPCYSRNLLNVVSRFPSNESMLAITAFVELITEAARRQPHRHEEFGGLSLLCLAVIQSWAPFVRQVFSADESNKQSVPNREKLVRCLRRALSDAVAGRTALHILVSHLQEYELPPLVVLALDQSWATAGDCDVILQRYYSADSSRKIMIAAFDDAHKSSILTAGVKLYQYKTAMVEFDFTADSVAIVDMHDRLTASDLDAFVKDLTSARNLLDG